MPTDEKKKVAEAQSKSGAKPLAGDALEEAKLEELVADSSPGPHATVIREMARLQQDNRHLKKQNLRVWSMAGLLSVGLIGVVGATFWWFPKYRYIATTDNKAVCKLETQDNAITTPATIEDFAKEAAINSYSYDYVNYREIINDATNRYFTEHGRKAFMKSLDDSGNLERVVKGRLIMKAYVTTSPQLESEGTEGSRRYWTVHVPLAIDFYVSGSTGPTNSQDFLAEVKVMQDQASALNPKGINVDSIILKPSPRRK
jgi:intracellular multiplication protein IcmL